MPPMIFAKRILSKKPISVFNHGKMSRDFTYIDDLVLAIRLLIDANPINLDQKVKKYEAIDSKSPVASFRLVNIGNSQPEQLSDFISALEKSLGVVADKNFMSMQPGDVPATWADTGLLEQLTGYQPKTKIVDGVTRFVDWYRNYYSV